MNFAIISSTQDPAGITIKNSLIELGFQETEEKFENYNIFSYNNAKLYTTNTDSIYCEDIDKKIDADFFIFATRHKAASGIHSLSVHTQGNWAKAEFGGKERELAIAPASYLREALLKLEELASGLHYEIIQEATHHGPHVEKPSMFIEIGSDETQWSNTEAGLIIGKTIIHLITNEIKKCSAAFGIGGLHHTPIFKKIIQRMNVGFGHVCPKYNLEFLDKEMIQQALAKTYEKVDVVILDWKGMGKEKERIVKVLDEMNIEYKQAEKMLGELS